MSSFPRHLAFVLTLMLTSAGAVFAQKAEPLCIEFAKGTSSATKSGRLSNGQEMDFVFGAVKGQTISVKVTSSLNGRLFDFTLAGDGFELETIGDAYRSLSFKAPVTGDYFLTVRRRPTVKKTSARFYLLLTIR